MRKILIVIDMQKDFVSGVLGNAETKAIVPKVCEKIRNWDEDHILYTLDAHEEPFYSTTEEGKRVPLHCVYCEDGYYLEDDIQAALMDYEDARDDQEKAGKIDSVVKETFGAVDELPYMIEKCMPEHPFQIHMVGVCTDICVISNALVLRSAFPKVEIYVDASCCAGTTPENHKAALAVMKANCINVINEE